ncbi:MAG: hypothetical protein BMS9Abin36_1946 [Gammaproteobacteria bacterium]|nr:MAG: hypothetical protein BMS9Abin36_1946 [Gammaproteobacteria bacterium]
MAGLRILITGMVVILIIQTPVAAVSASTGDMTGYDRKAITVLLKQGKLDRLESFFTALTTASLKSYEKERELYQAFLAFENSDPGLERILKKWIAKKPDSYSSHVALGYYYLHSGWLARGGRFSDETWDDQFKGMADYFSLAVKSFKRALEINDRPIPAYSGVISVATSNCDVVSINYIAKKVLSSRPASSSIYTLLLHSMKPKWCGSIGMLTSLLKDIRKQYKKNPYLKIFEGYDEYAAADSVKQDCQKSITILDALIRRNPNPLYLEDRGDVYNYCIDDERKSIADYTQALHVGPLRPRILADRAVAYYALKDFRRALANADEAILLDGNNPKALRVRGRIHYRERRYESAIKDLEGSLRFGGFSYSAHKYLGYIYYKHRKDYAKAAIHLEQAIQLGSRSGKALYYLTKAFWYNKDCKLIWSAGEYLKHCATRSCKSKKLQWTQTALTAYRNVKKCESFQG